ncbi:MAG: PRK06851 family protein [Peptococcaceae bacterium]|nr:PRK06851 family protein [Peptococcaceae bacterium]
MGIGSIKKVFPGGNTSKGFYSFYDYIIDNQEATRIFVIKGGPGVGKSTFIRKIGEAMLERGYDVEFHCCPSDNGSLDGVVIPAIRVALLDGTAPHVVDPKNPGAVDEIIHLGDHWNTRGLVDHKQEILEANREVGRLFRRAYGYLASAKIFLDQVESYYQDTSALDVGALDNMCLELTHEIFEGQVRQTDKPRARRLFITAITPDGSVSHLDTVVDHLSKRYIISGDDGTGKTTLVRRLMDAAMMRGFNVEAYHCALSPDNIDHLVIPALDTVVINSVEPHFYKPRKGDRVIDTMQFVNPVLNTQYLAEKTTAREMYRRCMELAVDFIAKAKAEHDRMETYYVSYMNFDEINARREKTLMRILELAEEHK